MSKELATPTLSLTPKQQERFDKWSKEQIYEAYLIEHEARKQSEARFKRLNMRMAAIRASVG